MSENVIDETAQTGFSQDQIDRFRQEGYLSVGKVVDDDLLESLRGGYDHEFGLARKNGRFRNLAISNTDDLDAKNNAEKQMLQITQMCERNLAYRKLIYNEDLLNFVESLL